MSFPSGLMGKDLVHSKIVFVELCSSRDSLGVILTFQKAVIIASVSYRGIHACATH